jgi:hypothetical protein
MTRERLRLFAKIFGTMFMLTALVAMCVLTTLVIMRWSAHTTINATLGSFRTYRGYDMVGILGIAVPSAPRSIQCGSAEAFFPGRAALNAKPRLVSNTSGRIHCPADPRILEMIDARFQSTPMTEAIAFVGATLGEPFTSAHGNGLYWSAFAVPRDDDGSYPIGVENLGSEVKVIVNLDPVGGNRDAIMRLYAIIGWATYHEHECEHDGFERD